MTVHGLLVCMHCDLVLRVGVLVQGIATPLGYEQQQCEISRSDMAVRIMARTRILDM